MTIPDWLAGTYVGSGSWYEATGRSQNYRIRHTNRGTDTGFEILFKHDFEDAGVVEANFTMTWTSRNLFSVSTGGKLMGNGYLMDEFCHYHLEVGGAFVAVNLTPVANRLRVFGSSTKNKEGHYIAWSEVLERAKNGD